MKKIDDLIREAYPDELAQLPPIPVEEHTVREKTFAKLGVSIDTARTGPAHAETGPIPVPAVQKKRRGLRILAGACAAAAACAVLLLGVNAVNPAFMENLPGVGAAFRYLNGTSEKPGPDTPAPPPVSTSSSPWGDRYFKCSIQEASLLGSDLHLTLQAHTSLDLSADTSQWYYSLTLNGEELSEYQGSSLDTFRTWTKTQEDTCYNDGIVIPLPEEDAARLSGEVQGVLNLVFTDLSDPEEDSKQYVYDLSFTLGSDGTGSGTGSVWTNEEITFSVDTSGAEQNGVKLLAFEGKGNQARMSVGFPEIKGDGNEICLTDIHLYRPNGDELTAGEYEAAGAETPGEIRTILSGTYGLWFQEDFLVAAAFQYDRKGEKKGLLAEFTIDLTQNTAAPSERYKDPEGNFYWTPDMLHTLVRVYPYYRASEEQLAARKDDYQVAYLTQSPGFLDGFTYLVLATDREYRDLRVSVSCGEDPAESICSGAGSETLGREFLDSLPIAWGDVEEQSLFLPFQQYEQSVTDLFFSNWSFYMETNLQVYNGIDLGWELDESGLNAQVFWLPGAYSGYFDPAQSASGTPEEKYPGALYSYEPGKEYTVTVFDAQDGSVLHTETIVPVLPENVSLPENTRLVRAHEDGRPYVPVDKSLLKP